MNIGSVIKNTEKKLVLCYDGCECRILFSVTFDICWLYQRWFLFCGCKKPMGFFVGSSGLSLSDRFLKSFIGGTFVYADQNAVYSMADSGHPDLYPGLSQPDSVTGKWSIQ